MLVEAEGYICAEWGVKWGHPPSSCVRIAALLPPPCLFAAGLLPFYCTIKVPAGTFERFGSLSRGEHREADGRS